MPDRASSPSFPPGFFDRVDESPDSAFWKDVTPQRIIRELCGPGVQLRVWQSNDCLVTRAVKPKVLA